MKQDNKLALLGGQPILKKSNDAKFDWPPIDKSIEKVIVEQARKTISIYNRSDIFEKFEDDFAKYHKIKRTLLFSSGTAAIHAMFVAADLGPSDEIICPAYTFFATVSPIFFTGAKPILVDCDKSGNIDPILVENAITPRTKAIIVTHMWGLPADMNKLSQIAKKHKLLLLEDCSHAHGAKINGKLVGTWGDMAAWSLQGQKIVTGGEGGVLATKHDEYYYKALLFGHYNKRCKSEIPSNHPLYKFAITGMGLKLRAHPIAMAIADNYLHRLNCWLKIKRDLADIIIKHTEDTGLQSPVFNKKDPSWYAFVWQYNKDQYNGLPIEIFHKALVAEGLVEFDLPRSTCPLNNLPLFQNPHQLFPNNYKAKVYYKNGQFPQAEKFYSQALKMPVWVDLSKQNIVKKYLAGIDKVSDNVDELIKKFSK